MTDSKLKRDSLNEKKEWNNFILVIRPELSKIANKLSDLEIKIKEIEKIKKIIELSKNNIAFIINHKKTFIEIDESLESKFKILTAFSNHNNLDNDLAIEVYNAIITNTNVNNLILSLDDFISQSEELQNRYESLKSLITEEEFSLDLIFELCINHNISKNALKYILFYPLTKNAIKKEKKDVNLTNQKNQEPEITKNKILENIDILEEEPITNVSKENTNEVLNNEILNENLIYFNNLRERYNKIKKDNQELMNKYYIILTEMTNVEMQFYRVYSSYSEDEFNNEKIEDNYEEAKSKIYAIKLFDTKNEIEKIFETIKSNNYNDKYELEYLEEYINEFEELTLKLDKIDKSITTTNTTTYDESKVFFLTDRSAKPCIPDEIMKGNLKNSLINIMLKAQEGYISKKRHVNVMKLKVHDVKFKELVDKTVFAVRNSKIMVSYIKVNGENELSNDTNIIILTATLANKGTEEIQNATNKIIKEYRDQILNQIKLLESKNPQYIGIQSILRDEIKSEENYKRGYSYE